MNDFKNQILKITENAAISCYDWIGKGDGKAADKAAVDAMRKQFDSIEIDGTVVIGEGERDEAPMLYIGEKVGTGNGEKYDIAVDPLEGTNLCAKNLPNSISVLVISPQGTLLHAPDTYMDKIAVGPKVGSAVSLENSVKENLQIISEKLNKPIEELQIIMLKRERNEKMAKEILDCGSKIKYIDDGDVFGAVSPIFEDNDALFGIGAAPEGVLACGALKPLGGYFEGKLKFRNQDERKRAVDYGTDPDKLFKIDELVKGSDSLFVASGVTKGDYLNGVKLENNSYTVNSLLVDKEGKRTVTQTLLQ